MLDTDRIGRRGLMFVLSSPSGAGKTTLTRLLREQETSLTLSVSVTTRARRPSEVEGVHYRFVTPEAFAAMRDGGELLEWAEVHGNLYGSPRGPIEQALAQGRDILFDIDFQGARQVRRNAPDDVVSVFVLPPSIAELRLRLERRAEDGPEVIARRLANARIELGHWAEYDYIIVNDDLDRSYAAVRAILTAARLKRERRTGLGPFVAGLLCDL